MPEGDGVAIRQWTRETVGAFLERLDMVEWDRFVVGEDYHGEKHINVYGWIERTEDEYKDFVILRFWPDLDEDGIVGFTTSSDRHTEEIFRRLFGREPDDHNDCRRVEHTFDVENAIELTENSSLEEYA